MNKIDFETFKQLLLDADSKGKLIIDKHNPDKVSTIISPFRSVVSKKIADNFLSFINEEMYSIKEYYNTEYPLSPLYFTITPNPDSSYLIASSGITGNVPSSAMDTLIVVSGGTKGIHMFGSSSIDISNRVIGGTLFNERILK